MPTAPAPARPDRRSYPIDKQVSVALSLSERVVVARSRARLTQARLARLAGCSVLVISLLEQGRRYPSDEIMINLFTVLSRHMHLEQEEADILMPPLFKQGT